jgi:hypothetical protein
MSPVTAFKMRISFDCPAFSYFREKLATSPNDIWFRLHPEFLLLLGTRVKPGGEVM